MDTQFFLTAAAATAAVWAAIRFAPSLYTAVRGLLKRPPAGPAADPMRAAENFFLLREFFAQTGQTGRMRLMNDSLAAGVFATPEHPADDLPTPSVLRVHNEEPKHEGD